MEYIFKEGITDSKFIMKWNIFSKLQYLNVSKVRYIRRKY